MNLREEYYRTRQLRAIAGQAPVAPATIAQLIQPFIDRHKVLRLPRRVPGASGGLHSPHPSSAPPSAPDLILRRVADAGVGCRRAGLKGLAFHNTLQRKVAALAEEFGYRGFMECYASYDTDETAEHPGRMDVVWAAERTPMVLFELDSTVKRISFRKLQLSEGVQKFWIYFGADVWGFKTSLAKWDPAREVMPVIIPRSFVPGAAGGAT